MHWGASRRRNAGWSTPSNLSICSRNVTIIVTVLYAKYHCLLLFFILFRLLNKRLMTHQNSFNWCCIFCQGYRIIYTLIWHNMTSFKWLHMWSHCGSLTNAPEITTAVVVCAPSSCFGWEWCNVFNADCFCRVAVRGWTGASHSWCPLHLGDRKWPNAPLPVYSADTQNGCGSGRQPLPVGRTVQKRALKLERLHTTKENERKRGCLTD